MANKITGSSGDDTITGTAQTDQINAQVGDDQVLAGAGDDRVRGDTGHDTIDGGDGADWLHGGLGNDLILGGAGDDSVIGDTGNDTLSGADGADWLRGGSGDDQIAGGSGDDTLIGDDGDDTLDGGEGADSLRSSSGNDQVSGGGGDDTVAGGSGDDEVTGGEGSDSLRGNSGDDMLSGDAGDDTIFGDSGADQITGGAGSDSISAGSQDDTVSGGAGDDTISGASGADMIDGGAGNDRVDAGSQNDLVSGGLGDDRIDGSSGNDTLFGGAGNDTLKGGSSSDWISGGAGDDVIEAGGYGGGADTIRFEAEFGHDTIYGFSPSKDFIHIGDTDPADVTFTPTGDPQVWVLTLENVPDASLTLDFTYFWDTSLDATDLAPRVISTADAPPPIDPFADPVCLTAGMRVETARGPCPAAALQPGDLLRTLDAGLQPVRVVLRRTFCAAEIRQNPALRPVTIPAGAFGGGKPGRDLVVSMQHCFLACHRANASEWLIRARHVADMLGRGRIDEQDPKGAVTYVHLLMDRHHLIRAEGVWTESLFAGPRALAADPVLRQMVGRRRLPAASNTARPVLTRRDLRHDANFILGRRRGGWMRALAKSRTASG